MIRHKREYAIALQYVRQHYPNLHRCAFYIALVPADVFPTGQMGQCDGSCNVSVSDGCSTVGEFVDTLIHELTHCYQNRRKVTISNLEREEQAYAAGILARNVYERNEAPWRDRK